MFSLFEQPTRLWLIIVQFHSLLWQETLLMLIKRCNYYSNRISCANLQLLYSRFQIHVFKFTLVFFLMDLKKSRKKGLMISWKKIEFVVVKKNKPKMEALKWSSYRMLTVYKMWYRKPDREICLKKAKQI